MFNIPIPKHPGQNEVGDKDEKDEKDGQDEKDGEQGNKESMRKMENP
jgi:hypothetical protein